MTRYSTYGILDARTKDVPGTVQLFDPTATSEKEASSQASNAADNVVDDRKRGPGGVILNPQPDDHPDDPLNWAPLRRDIALLCLGWHCLVGGGMTPVLAAGFQNVSATFDVSIPQVALTTGFYMLGLGIGCLLWSPFAILYGKRLAYILGAMLFVVSSIWCALAPSYGNLVAARIFMGIGVAPCEALPSATIAEIFFSYERAFRVGIYTLLLLSGKNLVPLVSATIIQSMGWRWVFWIVAIIVGVNCVLLFLFVPETFWKRTPIPRSQQLTLLEQLRNVSVFSHSRNAMSEPTLAHTRSSLGLSTRRGTASHRELSQTETVEKEKPIDLRNAENDLPHESSPLGNGQAQNNEKIPAQENDHVYNGDEGIHGKKLGDSRPDILEGVPVTPMLRAHTTTTVHFPTIANLPGHDPSHPKHVEHLDKKSYVASLSLWNGRMTEGNFFKIMARPLVLYAYPGILWSTVVYSLSIGWLIVLSESIAEIYRHNPYNFSPLGCGLVYISPFVGGLLGTVVAGKVSDVIVRFMAKRNNGVYEPEFRLLMAIPIVLSTVTGLMGYGWSAQDHDTWIVPTLFFGIISFGCSIGSTTSITYAVDCYRQYAGEALVTLNFSKNIFHGFVFSLFFNRWLQADGSRLVFICLGSIQLFFLLWTIPLWFFGKRARAWTSTRTWMSNL